jgi:hypothetical protein
MFAATQWVEGDARTHCWAVWMSFPWAHCEFHALAPAKQPNATPESTAPAWKTSGYAPASTLVIIAPDDEPVTKTRLASTPQFAIA